MSDEDAGVETVFHGLWIVQRRLATELAEFEWSCTVYVVVYLTQSNRACVGVELGRVNAF